MVLRIPSHLSQAGHQQTLRQILGGILAAIALFLSGTAFAAITITAGSNGINLSADKSANAISPSWTTLGPIILDEVGPANKGDFGVGAGITLILKAPTGFEFNTAVTPGITVAVGGDITSASVAVNDSTTLTVTLSVSGGANVDRYRK